MVINRELFILLENIMAVDPACIRDWSSQSIAAEKK